MEKLDILAKNLGLAIKNKKLFQTAFIHRSYLNESKSELSSNERLEFLGDSILSFSVSSYLYDKFPHFQEGELTDLRANIVKTTTLAQIARSLKLGEYLLLSRGEEDGEGRSNPSILADTFEAMIGVIFLDQGLSVTSKVLNDIIKDLIPKILQTHPFKDSKSSFQELVQEATKFSPNYKVIGQIGPDHAKEFTVAVYVGDTRLGTGKGKSKQEAEQMAATEALENWRKK